MRKILCIFLLFFITLTASSLTCAQTYLINQFASTIVIDDPLVSDKLILTNEKTESPADNGGDKWTTNPRLIYGKTITKDLQISVTGSYLHIQNPGEGIQNGFDNWVAGLRYNVFNHPQTGTIFSLAFNVTIGGTGSHIVNAASTTDITPEVLFGQSLGNLPDNIKYLKPLTFIAAISPEITTTNYTVTDLNVGAAIEYYLPTLQEFTNSSLVRHLVPIIEFPFDICTQGSCQTTGTINPGFIILNRYGQLGIEAIIPSNSNTGNKVGGVLQLHLFLDNVFSNNALGRPIF